MLKRMKLGTKVLLTFLLVGLLPFSVISVLALSESSNALSKQVFNQLESVREIKKAQVEDFFASRFSDMVVLSKNMTVIEALNAFQSAFVANGNEVGGSLWKRVAGMYGKSLHDFVSEYGYSDLFLLNKTGDIIYTVSGGADLGTNLLQGKLKASALAEAVRTIKGKPVLVDLAPYPPRNNEPVAFIVAPATDSDGEMVGLAALQIPLKAINHIMTERAGMGETGESYLVGSDYLMRSDSFLDPDHHSVRASFADPQHGLAKTFAVKAALAGNSGNKISSDYRGSSVLCAYAPVKAGNLTWAMLVDVGSAEAFAPVTSMKTRMALTFVIGLIIIVAIAIPLARSITGPIIKGVRLAREISLGDFSQRLRMDRGDEIGQLAGALDTMADSLKANADLAEQIADGNLDVQVNLASDKDQLGLALRKMTDNLNQMLSQLRGAGELIDSGSNQVSDSSQSLSQGATEQASSLEEISASLNQITSQTGTTAENAGLADRLTKEVREAAQQGSDHMELMVGAMQAISTAGQNISKIIKTIDEIAFQTNLLALNAAVEAARAGQHGKGFAVVAEEVRNLAARSAKAAEETAELIEGSVEKTENGSVTASRTAEALQQIVGGINKVADLVGEIATASNEQAQGIAQINQGIGQVDLVTQQNTANAEETAAAAEELAGQAEQLRLMLQQFNLRQTREQLRLSSPASAG